jgi:hypothetical protein
MRIHRSDSESPKRLTSFNPDHAIESIAADYADDTDKT